MVTVPDRPMRCLSLAVLAIGLGGCVTRPPETYSWGHYEDLLYASYLSAADMPADKQAALMEQDYQVARAANRRMPPGWHAHLGYCYYQLGKLDQARQEMLTEKAEYPESRIFMDRLLANLKDK